MGTKKEEKIEKIMKIVCLIGPLTAVTGQFSLCGSRNNICDHKKDCLDGQDEIGCGTAGCNVSKY